MIIQNGNLETTVAPSDFVNPEYFEPHNTKQRAFILLNGGFCIGVVFAEYQAFTEWDALDEACDRGRLDAFQVSEAELPDYQTGTSGEGYPEYEGLIHLGNASEPFDIEALDVWTVPASTFAECDSLMTPDRVMAHLEASREAADAKYQACAINAPEWLACYKARDLARDACTIAWYATRR